MIRHNEILPSFLVVGAPKAGTTSLYYYLVDHPDIYAVRDANYFSYSEVGRCPPTKTPTLRQYSELFEQAPRNALLGDVSGSYLYSAVAPNKIKRYIPNAKVIVSLRNPVERAYSNYKMLSRMSGDMPRAPNAVSVDDGWVKKSFYYFCLKRYYELFGADHLKVILFEEFDENMGRVVKELYRFVGVDPKYKARTDVKYNAGGEYKVGAIRGIWYVKELLRPIRSYLPKSVDAKLRRWNAVVESKVRRDGFPPLPQRIRRDLLELYLPDIEKVEKLTELDCSCWLDDV